MDFLFDIVDGVWRTAPTRPPPRHLIVGTSISREARGHPPLRVRPLTPRPDSPEQEHVEEELAGDPISLDENLVRAGSRSIHEEAPLVQGIKTDGVSALQEDSGPLSPQGDVTTRSAADPQDQHDASDNGTLEPRMTSNASQEHTSLSNSSEPETSIVPERPSSPTEASTGTEKPSSPTEASTGTEKPNCPTETSIERLSSPTETEGNPKSPSGSTETSVGPQKRSSSTEPKGPEKRVKSSHVEVSTNSEAAEAPTASTDVK